MLPSFEAAYCVYGPKQKVAAYDCGVSDRHFYKWSTGRCRCPKHKRQSVDRALGAKVDWEQYDREFDACNRPPEPERAPVTGESIQSIQRLPDQRKEPKRPTAPRQPLNDPFKELYGDVV